MRPSLAYPPGVKDSGSCSSKGLPWRGRYLKVVELPVTPVKLGEGKGQPNRPHSSLGYRPLAPQAVLSPGLVPVLAGLK